MLKFAVIAQVADQAVVHKPDGQIEAVHKLDAQIEAVHSEGHSEGHSAVLSVMD
jgi:hypothetical protein